MTKQKSINKSDVSALIRRCFWKWEAINTQGLRRPLSSVVEWRDYVDLTKKKNKRWSSFHPKSFRRVQRSPLCFPDISLFLCFKTPKTPLHIFLLQKRGSPPPRNRQSCSCPRGLCTLVWMELPPGKANKR